MRALGHFLSCSPHLWVHLSTLNFHLDGQVRFSVRFPGGLVARIRRFHRRGPGSIPGQGKLSFFQRLHVHESLSALPDRDCILLKGPVQNISAQSF